MSNSLRGHAGYLRALKLAFVRLIEGLATGTSVGARDGCYIAVAMSHAYRQFSHISGSPRSTEHFSLFGGRGAGASTTSSNLSQQLQDLISQVNDQGSVLTGLVGAVTGKSGGSELQSVLGGSSFGSSVLGSVASGGFSVTSLLKDILPLGGLISGIAGLFSSTPTPAALDQYDAPPSLNFDAVLNSDGTLSQGSGNQYGQTRASSAGLDLVDAAGGPYSPYARAASGSLKPVAGDPATKYSGMVNLPDLVGPLTQGSAQASAPQAAASTPASAADAAATAGSGAGLTSTSSNNPGSAQPNFDAQWFNDHGSLIASAVRNELLNFHPIVDTINDL